MPGCREAGDCLANELGFKDLEAELIRVGGWDASSDSEGDRCMKGSEDHFDENVAEEERSTDGEDGSGEEVRERAGVSAREIAQVEVRGESTLVWRRR